MKNKLILWLVLLVIGFLAGFIPQYLETRRVRFALREANEERNSCRSGLATSQLGNIAAMLYLEATRKNYGTAGEYSSRLFTQIQQVLSTTADSPVKAALTDVLGARDTVTADLARGDPAVVTDLQPIVTKLEQAAKP